MYYKTNDEFNGSNFQLTDHFYAFINLTYNMVWPCRDKWDGNW